MKALLTQKREVQMEQES